LTKLIRPPFPQLPLPLNSSGLILPTLLKNVVEHFSVERLTKSYTFAYKNTECVGITGRTQVLKESVYCYEFAAILLSWFPDTVTVAPEATCDTKESDIFLCSSAFKVVFEFVANERFGPVTRNSSFFGPCQKS